MVTSSQHRSSKEFRGLKSSEVIPCNFFNFQNTSESSKYRYIFDDTKRKKLTDRMKYLMRNYPAQARHYTPNL
uniref:Uncharacterized protein n=1 Tax=Rhodnius prolixus TaxID=13249 RepID=T1I3R7_RHOPR